MAQTPIRSPMVGMVSMVFVETGATVAKDERVAEIECMKTFFGVTAPKAGVLKLRIEPGSYVGQDEVLGWVE